jgi:hypothetical protein
LGINVCLSPVGINGSTRTRVGTTASRALTVHH